MNADASKRAAEAQQRAGQEAIGDINTGYNTARTNQQPYYDVGTRSMDQLAQNQQSGKYNVAPSEFKYQGYNPTQLNPQNLASDPGYQFRLQQGTQATQNSAAAQGAGLSGATQKALARYGQNFASNEYQNAFSRNLASNQFGAGQQQLQNQFGFDIASQNYNQRQQQAQEDYNRQLGLSNMGERAANNLSNIGMGQGNALAGIRGQMGNAQASGIMGSSLGNMVSNLGGDLGSLAMMGLGNMGGSRQTSQPLPNMSYQTPRFQMPSAPLNAMSNSYQSSPSIYPSKDQFSTSKWDISNWYK